MSFIKTIQMSRNNQQFFPLTVPRPFSCCNCSLFVLRWFHLSRLSVPHLNPNPPPPTPTHTPPPHPPPPPPRLHLVPREGCVSWLWHFLGIFKYSLRNRLFSEKGAGCLSFWVCFFGLCAVCTGLFALSNGVTGRLSSRKHAYVMLTPLNPTFI